MIDTNHPLLVSLNTDQQQAVTANDSRNLLVVAGAGSGKTRVIVHRIAWLIKCMHVPPYGIMAVTFTNKAATEMRERVAELLKADVRDMWIGTFHGTANRLLRYHTKEAGLLDNFQIIDTTDQKRLIKNIVQELELDFDKYKLSGAQGFIGRCKEQNMRFIDADKRYANNPQNYKENLQIYKRYELACQEQGLVDFAELLMRATRLFDLKDIRERYQRRFQYVLVDEFQDTNEIQHCWLKQLAGKEQHLMAVGDEDQTIYGWRGARAEFMVDFQNDPETQMCKLEQNYRSTGNILKAANTLIENNPDRLGKTLWTEQKEGELLSVFGADDEWDEARFVVDRLVDWHAQGGRYSDAVALCRTNAQTRPFENILREHNIPFVIRGGHPFYERVEIKDALAYLRLVANIKDDIAIERALGTPSRGIGATTTAKLRANARQHNDSMWEAMIRISATDGLTARINKSITEFIALIKKLTASSEDCNLGELMRYCIAESGLRSMYENKNDETSKSKLENLDELIAACAEYDGYAEANIDAETSNAVNGATPDNDTNPAIEPISTLNSFLSRVVLDSGDRETDDENSDSFSLMTMHAVKGLEFDLVFMVGLEEGVLPHFRSISEGDISEERRLCYVGLTRARKKLYLSYAALRRAKMAVRSSFIKELPEELLDWLSENSVTALNGSGSYDTDAWKSQKIRRQKKPNILNANENIVSAIKTQVAEGVTYQIGARVLHPKFGEGIIQQLEGSGEHARVRVRFKKLGSKWLILAYAKLQVLD